jgi:formate-dependent phosphoribosylglycinamide formyltransferase (GAR transformylase)
LTKTKLLVIGAGKHQVDVVKKSALAGYETIAVDIDPLAEGFIYAHQAFVQSAYNHEEILQSLDRTGQIDEIRGVITQAARECIPTVSKVSESLGLRHLNVETAELSLQKGKLSRKLNPNAFIGEYENFGCVPKWPDFPFIVKWEGASGGSGVHLIQNMNELQKVKSEFSFGQSIIVEKYVRGQSFGVMGLVHDGVIKIYGIAEKFLSANLTLDEVIYPAAISSDLFDVIIAYSRKILKALRFDFGPFQLELIVDDTKNPYFVELEPSVLGSYISEWMIPATSDNDMVMDSIKLVCEGRFDPNTQDPGLLSLLKYHYPDNIGMLKSITFGDMDRRILFKPFYNSGDQIIEKRMYIANSQVLGRNVNEMKEVLKNKKIQVTIQT